MRHLIPKKIPSLFIRIISSISRFAIRILNRWLSIYLILNLLNHRKECRFFITLLASSEQRASSKEMKKKVIKLRSHAKWLKNVKLNNFFFFYDFFWIKKTLAQKFLLILKWLVWDFNSHNNKNNNNSNSQQPVAPTRKKILPNERAELNAHKEETITSERKKKKLEKLHQGEKTRIIK